MNMYERSHLEHLHNDQRRLELDLARINQDHQRIASLMMMPPPYLKSTEQLQQELSALVHGNLVAYWTQGPDAYIQAPSSLTEGLSRILHAMGDAKRREERHRRLVKMRKHLQEFQVTLPMCAPSVTGTPEPEEPIEPQRPWAGNGYLKSEDHDWLEKMWNAGQVWLQ